MWHLSEITLMCTLDIYNELLNFCSISTQYMFISQCSNFSNVLLVTENLHNKFYSDLTLVSETSEICYVFLKVTSFLKDEGL